jgi:hypothetical protein
MAVESQVQELLDEIADSGRTPEQVCVACLELLPEVRHPWQQMRILEAVEYATTVCKLTGWKEPGFLDTLAAAYAQAGQFEEAIRYQTRALGDPTFKARFGPAARQRLKLYQQQKQFRDQ